MMFRRRLWTLLFCLVLAAPSSWAGDNGTFVQPEAASSQPAPVLAPDSSENPKWFTVSATLREEYDDNIFTSKDNKQGSFKTEFSPSFLVDIPLDNSEFSARYTFDGIYYSDRSGTPFDLNHEFVTRYDHSFSDRFSIDLRDMFRHFDEPSLFESVGTPYRSGTYNSNLASAEFTAQWTPLFGTVTTYSNSLIKYDDQATSNEQDYMENTVSQDMRFNILPNYTLIFGGIFDDLSYDHVKRGYTQYVGNAGVDWQVTPTLVIGGRVGGTIMQGQAGTGETVLPYGSATVNWTLGKRSELDFNYTHSVVPTDVDQAVGQEADRFTATFKYDVTANLTAHLQGIYTHGSYSQSFLFGNISSFTEDVVGIDTGFDYHFDKNFDYTMGYTFSNVSSGLDFRNYTRNQVYVGVRGTY